MGSTLGELKTKLNYAVGTAETNLLDEDKRTDAINEAIRTLLRMYPIPQYTISTTLTFTSGVASLPTDCLMPYKLRVASSNIEYEQLDFDRFQYSVPYSYNIYFDTSSNVEKIRIYDTSATSLEITYLQVPDLLEDDSDTTRLNVWWDKAIAEKAAEQLFISIQNFAEASAKETVAKNAISEAWQIERARLQGQPTQRLQSVFEKHRFIQSGLNLRN